MRQSGDYLAALVLFVFLQLLDIMTDAFEPLGGFGFLARGALLVALRLVPVVLRRRRALQFGFRLTQRFFGVGKRLLATILSVASMIVWISLVHGAVFLSLRSNRIASIEHYRARDEVAQATVLPPTGYSIGSVSCL